MNGEKIFEETAVKIAKIQGVNMDEARKSLMEIVKSFNTVFENISKMFKSLFDVVKENWEIIRELSDETNNKRKQNDPKTGWILQLDTSRRSQVLLNKPRFSIRKII